jgi:hypothetical protein
LLLFFFWQYWDLNSEHCVCQASALQPELPPVCYFLFVCLFVFNFSCFSDKGLCCLFFFFFWPKLAWDSDPPAYTSCTAGMIVMSHHTWPISCFEKYELV